MSEALKINADFSRRAIEHSERMDWVPSPMAGVSRRMLDRIGGEVARATSIVRYDPGSQFSPHVHNGGEEFLVLDGIFQDEHGDYPVGTYVRNPVSTRHTPASKPGCQIFVKLWQFDPAESGLLRIDTHALELEPDPRRPAVQSSVLFQDAAETVTIEEWEGGKQVSVASDGGAELLLLSGEIQVDGETLSKHSWLRLPMGETLTATVAAQGVRLWMKTGHLRYVRAPD